VSASPDRSLGGTSGDETLELRAGDAVLRIDPDVGGRIASVVVDGNELLVTEGYGPIEWGCYPMAPFAGRIRDGRFTFRGRSYELARNMPPSAIHGTVFERVWDVATHDEDRATLAIDLGAGWPFAGRARQSFALTPEGLEASLVVEADEPMPAWLGWHPWFRRRLSGTSTDPRPPTPGVLIDVAPGRMYERGSDGLPTGALVAPSPGPWDDAFVDLARPPRVTWPGVLTLEIASTAGVWVVFDERPDKVCVEPQTAPPDAVNLPGDPAPTAEPGRPVSIAMTWRWLREDERPD
jgi:aldose 1-epimerase